MSLEVKWNHIILKNMLILTISKEENSRGIKSSSLLQNEHDKKCCFYRDREVD